MDDTKQSSSGLDFKLHPLVLINVSDHHTRVKANGVQQGDGGGRVLGCLLGNQDGRVVDVSNSFEILYKVTPEGIEIDQEFLVKKRDQYKQVFPKLDVVGWYATGADVHEHDMALHKKVMEINESPVFLLLDPAIRVLRKDIPVRLFESELHTVDGRPTFIFVQAKYTVETSEAERIGVNQVAKVLPSGNPSGSEQLTAHFSSVHAAMKMLNGRIGILLQLLDKMAAGELPYDHSLVRQVSTLVRRLPAVKTPAFQTEFLKEYNDSLLTILLSSITKGSYTVNEIVDKFNIAYDKSARRRGML
ncbi:hypothetical protein WJX72_008457 [[Myrmecia] bisecta]|uniref:COP9 signalosome complex subunit 6 n=1 Tax=[Myrmecia] bisecta TaxID=41462 RepID=A0AAW1R8I8_9CHLO